MLTQQTSFTFAHGHAINARYVQSCIPAKTTLVPHEADGTGL